jgi:hypothetical protein
VEFTDVVELLRRILGIDVDHVTMRQPGADLPHDGPLLLAGSRFLVVAHAISTRCPGYGATGLAVAWAGSGGSVIVASLSSSAAHPRWRDLDHHQ